MFLRNPERKEDGMGREGRDYWVEQLSEYWDSGLTIQEYSELKELPYESTRRWIRVLRFGIAGAGRGQTFADRCKEWFRDSAGD